MGIDRKVRNITIDGNRFLGGHYPFDQVEIGKSFHVPVTRASYVTVVEVVRRRNKKSRGLFECIKVDDGTLVTKVDPSTVVMP